MHTGYVPEPEHRASQLRLGREPQAGRQTRSGAGDPAVRLGRRRQRRARFPRHGLCPLRRQLQRKVRNLKKDGYRCPRLNERMQMLAARWRRASSSQNRGAAAADHAKILDKTVSLMTSKQMDAFQGHQGAQGSPRTIRQLQLRPRLPDGPAAGGTGVPFVEVDSAAGTRTATTSARSAKTSCPSWTRR